MLEQMAGATQEEILVTVMMKGALEIRRRYYEHLGVPFTVDSHETITSELWERSRAYSLNDLERLARSAGLEIERSGTLAQLSLYAVLRARS